MSNNNNSNKENLIMLADPRSGPPPNTDMIFSNRAQLRTNSLHAINLAIATALSFGIMFLIISLIVWILHTGSALTFFELIYPGFELATIVGMGVGFLWSFFYGFIFGFIIGLVYNCLLRLGVLDGEDSETFA